MYAREGEDTGATTVVERSCSVSLGTARTLDKRAKGECERGCACDCECRMAWVGVPGGETADAGPCSGDESAHTATAGAGPEGALWGGARADSGS